MHVGEAGTGTAVENGAVTDGRARGFLGLRRANRSTRLGAAAKEKGSGSQGKGRVSLAEFCAAGLKIRGEEEGEQQQ